MQHVSDQHYRCPGMGSLTRYAAVFTGWRRLCLLTALLCGVATLAAADTHESRVTPAPVLGDLNGDGRDDVLLRHENGRWFYYPMDGRNHITDQRGYADLTRNLAWQFAGIGDLNGDERDDVLVRHTDGRWFYYPMDGRYHITGERGLAGLTRNLDWHVAGIGDLNGDGKDDVLLRNKNGRWYYYPMNGRRFLADERGYADLTRDLDWQVAGIGDLNGDGKDDVLLRHEDGRWDYYPMNGRNPITDQRGLAGLTRNLDWQVAGMGDLNGDGKDDVLLRHTDSRWYYYPMDGRRFLTDERGYAGLTRNLAWQVAGIGDLNGDGRDDVLLRHMDSRWYYYPMDGRNYLTDERGYANLTRNPDWSVVAADTLAPVPPSPTPGDGDGGSEGNDDSVSPEMVPIPGGTFQMGDLSGTGVDSEKPVHSVTLRPFNLGKYEVTFTQWDACVADGGCGGYRPDDRGWGRGNRPVIDVSWDDAQTFINWLNGNTGGNYRLPTEAEWEYAARAGSTTEYSWGNDIGHNWANCIDCGSRNYETVPVGSYPANAWALHDMHGNAEEWVEDCWHGNYQGAPGDGGAWTSGVHCSLRMIRGGSLYTSPEFLRSAFRNWNGRSARRLTFGLRLAQDQSGETVQGDPDLVVESPSVSSNSLTTGQSFTFSAVVHNRGAGSSDATTLRYYRSQNSTINRDDTPAGGTEPVSSLAASGASPESATLTVPSSSGTWYYGACVEPVSNESNTGNNCSSGARVTVTIPQIYNDNLIVLPIYEVPVNGASLDVRTYAKNIYAWFDDSFDYLMFFLNLPDRPDGIPFFGQYHPVSNDTEGIGRGIFFDNRYGSAGKLRGALLFPYNRALLNGPSLHELMHSWANYSVPTTVGAHWGFSSANGQLGGFDLEKLVDLGGGQYTTTDSFGTFANGGNSLPYSSIELYFAGLIAPEEVPDLWVAEDGEWLVDENNSLVRSEYETGTFTADFRIYTIDDIIAEHGARVPDWTESQKHFRAAVVLLTDENHPATLSQQQAMSERVSSFSYRGDDDSHLFNYYEATGGRGSITMDGLSQFQKAMPTGTASDKPASFGVLGAPIK